MRWPPIIEDTHLPFWVRARDVLLTLMAWCVIVYLIREPLLALAFWLLSLLGLAAPPASFERRMFVIEGRPFLVLSALFSVWLVTFALVRRKVLVNTRRSATDPEPLEPARHAARFGLDAAQLAALRQTQGATVQIDPDGSITRIDETPDALH